MTKARKRALMSSTARSRTEPHHQRLNRDDAERNKREQHARDREQHESKNRQTRPRSEQRERDPELPDPSALGKKPPPSELASDILWGVPQIASFIGRTERQTRHLISLNLIPAEKKSHKVIVASKRKITRELIGAGGE